MLKHLVDQAVQAGVENFNATSGRVPDNFRLMMEAAPATFAGYALMRAATMRDRSEGGALDLKTKEFIFVLLDVLAGNQAGAVAHLNRAMALGLTAPEVAEGLTQVLMVGGITTWNLGGAEVMRRAQEISGPVQVVPPPLG